MELAISTHWNAKRHISGTKLLEEILALGFSSVELGYDLRVDLVPGVVEMVRAGKINVVSVHNFCPLPTSAPRAHPEVYLFTDEDPRMREYAIEHTERTVRFSAEVGARVVVAHAGYVTGSRFSRDLIALCQQGRRHSPEYERLLQKGRRLRDERAERHLRFLHECLDRLAPVLEETGVTLALEILPTWEAVPNEFEMETFFHQRGSKRFACWYDIGHARIRENLGFVNTARWLDRLSPWIAGFHIHDVRSPAQDHLMPPNGNIDFSELKGVAQKGVPLVLEPASDTPDEQITRAVKYLNQLWELHPKRTTNE